MPIEVGLMDPAGTPPNQTERIPGIQSGQPVYFTPDSLHDYRHHEAASDPGAAHNTAAGYGDRHFWVNTSTQHVWFKLGENAGAATWVDLTAVTQPGGVTNLFTGDVDGDGYRLFDVIMEGFRDKPYDLATDALGLNVAGAVTLVKELNHVYHGNVTTALTITLPAVTAGEAPFGVFSFALATGGSIAIAATPEFHWEKVNTGDSPPSMPDQPGDVGYLYYRYDPVTASYALTLTRASATSAPPPSTLGIVPDSMQISNLSANNRNTHSTTHTFQSTTQDGSVYLIFGFLTDTISTADAYFLSSPPSGAVEIMASPAGTYGGRMFWFYYKPSQADLNAGSITLTIDYNNEIGQFVSFEVTGADETNPVHTTGADWSNSARLTAGPAELTIAVGGCLAVSACVTDDSNATVPMSFGNTSGWNKDIDYQPGVDATPNIIVHTREDVQAGTINTPTYTIAAADQVHVGAFALKPGAGA